MGGWGSERPSGTETEGQRPRERQRGVGGRGCMQSQADWGSAKDEGRVQRERGGERRWALRKKESSGGSNRPRLGAGDRTGLWAAPPARLQRVALPPRVPEDPRGKTPGLSPACPRRPTPQCPSGCSELGQEGQARGGGGEPTRGHATGSPRLPMPTRPPSACPASRLGSGRGAVQRGGGHI